MTMKRLPTFPLVVAGLLVVIFIVLWAGNEFQPLRSKEPPYQLRFDMFYQKKIGAQQSSTFFADGKTMRDAVPGTVPREGSQYAFTTFQQADSALTNPIPQATAAILARGKNRYQTFCSPCHSPSGQDTTETVRKGLPKPPNLLQNAPKYSDPHLFHIISAGQNIMPGYADKIPVNDRWAIVAWVRELQKAPLKHPLPAPSATAATDSTATSTTNAGKKTS